MNAPFNIRQLAQYPRQTAAIPGTVTLMQMGELGSPYASILTSDLVSSALSGGGDFNLSAPAGRINFLNDQGAGAVTLSVTQGELLCSTALRTSTLNATFVNAESVTQGGVPVATQADIASVRSHSVTSFNQRTGDILLETADILRAGGAPQQSPIFSGWVIAPSPWDVRINDDTVVTANWVHRLICECGVASFNGRHGDVVLTTSDVNAAYAVPGVWPTAPSPVLGDASDRIATTSFVDESLDGFAPTYSPNFTGRPTASTQPAGDSSTALATTAFVTGAVTGQYVPISGGTMTGPLNMTAGQFYRYNNKNLAYIVPNASGDNIFIGESGNVSVTGSNNVGNGLLALASVTTGTSNVGIGTFALNAVTTAINSVAVGSNALKNSNGGASTAVGSGALTAATSGGNNNAFGYSALGAETTGAGNVAVGYTALGTQNGASNNIGIGYLAGYNLTTGGNNVIVGYNAGLGITTGSGNTVIGYNLTGLPAALASTMVLGAGSVKMSIAFGTNAFYGPSAGNLTVTGTTNTGVGYLSSNALTTGSNNTSLGSNALPAETTGSFNVAVGRLALNLQNGGGSNTAVGYNAGSGITTGNSNTFIGQNTGVGITIGSGNTIIGILPSQAAALTNAIILAAGGIPRYDFNLTTANTHTFAGGPVVGPQVVTTPVNVSALPVASAALTGARAFVNDATATTFLSIVAGAGANKVPVVCNGTNWLIG